MSGRDTYGNKIDICLTFSFHDNMTTVDASHREEEGGTSSFNRLAVVSDTSNRWQTHLSAQLGASIHLQWCFKSFLLSISIVGTSGLYLRGTYTSLPLEAHSESLRCRGLSDISRGRGTSYLGVTGPRLGLGVARLSAERQIRIVLKYDMRRTAIKGTTGNATFIRLKHILFIFYVTSLKCI